MQRVKKRIGQLYAHFMDPLPFLFPLCPWHWRILTLLSANHKSCGPECWDYLYLLSQYSFLMNHRTSSLFFLQLCNPVNANFNFPCILLPLHSHSIYTKIGKMSQKRKENKYEWLEWGSGLCASTTELLCLDVEGRNIVDPIIPCLSIC